MAYEYPAEVVLERARQNRAMFEENERLRAENESLRAIAEAARAYRRAVADWRFGGGNQEWRAAEERLFAAIDADGGED